MHAFASFIMQGGRQATAVVVAIAVLSFLIPPLVVVSVAAVCLVTLRGGPTEGVLVLVGSTVGLALMGYIMMGTPVIALSYLFAMWLPAYIGSLVLRETASVVSALECLVLIGVVAVLGAYLVVDDPAQQWLVNMQAVVETLRQQQELPIGEVELQESIQFWSHYMTGLVIAGSLVSIVVGLMLGRWWQGLLYNPGGFGEEFSQLRLPQRDAIIFGVLVLTALFLQGEIAEVMLNIDIQALLLFMMAGVSVIRTMILRSKKGRFLLLGFYVALFFVPHLMLPVVLVGISDVWMDWRRRVV
jgi:hypothetical protein